MRFPANAIQQAVYARLRVDVPGMECFDVVPPEKRPPFCVLGDFNCNSELTKTDELLSVVATIFVWTREEGMKQLELLVSGVIGSLNRAYLDMAADGWRNYQRRLGSVVTAKFVDGTNSYQQAAINYAWKVQDLRAQGVQT